MPGRGKPVGRLSRRDEHRHAMMNRLNDGIGGGSGDHEFKPLVGSGPIEPAHQQKLVRRRTEPKRQFRAVFGFPLEKPVSRNQATLFLPGMGKRGLGGDGFRTDIDQQWAASACPAPMRGQKTL